VRAQLNGGEHNMEEQKLYRTITPREFAVLDAQRVTLVDLREPDEVLIHPVEGAINLPFSRFPDGLGELPKDRPAAVFCRSGEKSRQVAEILADRGYEVMELAGGYAAYTAFLNGGAPEESGRCAPESAAPAPETDAQRFFIDAKGLRCPGPIVKVADFLRDRPEGTAVRAEATEEAFASDIRVWCERTGCTLDALRTENGVITADITKHVPAAAPESAAPAGNGKTFVVFSGDLDKTIAAFIMANAAAAMGREVTVFFTFWGLNILRRPERVRVSKSFVERMFGLMMPRGTRALGLSRMNMGGAGAKMIRGVMKSRGVSSLEELMDDARAHGVRLVACQMSMDIMGIRREELIDGVELGGAATFLGSGERSDMSLFI